MRNSHCLPWRMFIAEVNMELPEAARTPIEEKRELLLLKVDLYVHMYQAQQALYQEKVHLATADEKAGEEFTMQQHTFIVDYSRV